MINKSIYKWLIIILFICFIIIPIIFNINEGFTDPLKVNGVTLNPNINATAQMNKNLKEVANDVAPIRANQNDLNKKIDDNTAKIINSDKKNNDDTTAAINKSLQKYITNNPDVNSQLKTFSDLISKLSDGLSKYNTNFNDSQKETSEKIDTTNQNINDINTRMLEYNTANMTTSASIDSMNKTINSTNTSYLDKATLLQNNYDTIQTKLDSISMNGVNAKLDA